MPVNLNDVAREVTLREGGKESISIAQVKEVIRHFIDVITEDNDLYDTVMCLRKHGNVGCLETKSERQKFKDFLDENDIM